MESFNEISSKSKRHSFVDEIKNKNDTEKQELLNLQIKYEKGFIKEEDMTLEQIRGIEKIYEEQIKKLKDENDRYKNKILSLKKKVSFN